MKRYLIVISILVITASALLFYLYQDAKKTSFENNSILEQENNATKNYLNYKDDNFNFSIDYRKDLNYKKNNNDKTLVFSNSSDSSIFALNIYTSENSNLSSREWWEQYGPQNDRQSPYPDEEKEIKIGDINAYYTSYEASKGSFGNQYFIPVFIYIAHKGSIFQISGVKVPDNIEQLGLTGKEIEEAREYEAFFNEMVQSFRFTE